MDLQNNMLDSGKQTIEGILLENRPYIGPTVGVSMLPLLKSRRDTVVIQPKTTRLQPLDVALYKRGNDYVLHRVLNVTDWGYIIRGDNCYSDEKILEKDVIGVLTEFFRKGKHYTCNDKKYLRYVQRRLKSYKIRRVYVIIKLKIRALAKKILKPFLKK